MLRAAILLSSLGLIATSDPPGGWMRLGQLDGAAPHRVGHILKAEPKLKKPGLYEIESATIVETTEGDANILRDAVQFDTLEIDCTHKTWRSNWHVDVSANGASVQHDLAKAKFVAVSGYMERFRAAVCDGAWSGLIAFPGFDPGEHQTWKYFR